MFLPKLRPWTRKHERIKYEHGRSLRRFAGRAQAAHETQGGGPHRAAGAVRTPIGGLRERKGSLPAARMNAQQQLTGMLNNNFRGIAFGLAHMTAARMR